MATGANAMRGDSEVRARYLSLALEVRKAIDSLVVFVEENREVPEMRPRVQDVVESLKTVAGERSVFAPVRNRRSYGHYEQIRTLDEVSRPQRQTIVERMSGILREDASPETRKQDAFEAIEFLYEVESRALRYYNEPARTRIG